MKYKIWVKDKKNNNEQNIIFNAKKQKLNLTKKHWEIIFLFKNYNENKKKNNLTNFYNIKKNIFIYKLFPNGFMQLRKIAGIIKNSKCF